eukprot:Rhum_TRINITY_DN19215_c0_g1::Rhum_TRINITY_DN19215_c0_g1_i1::g.169550::m.169550
MDDRRRRDYDRNPPPRSSSCGTRSNGTRRQPRAERDSGRDRALDRDSGRGGRQGARDGSDSDNDNRYLHTVIGMLKERKAMLEELTEVDEGTNHRFHTWTEPRAMVQMVQQSGQGNTLNRRSKGDKVRKTRILVLDREHNCTTFMKGVVSIPKGIEMYMTWNPATKNKPDFLPSVADRVTMVEANDSVLRAMNTLLGMIAREHLAQASTTHIYLVFNATSSPQRYVEIVCLLEELNFKVHCLNGAAPNFADFLQHIDKPYDEYTKIPPTGKAMC